MRDWKWFLFVPLLAAALVAGPLLFPRGSAPVSGPGDGTWRRPASDAAAVDPAAVAVSLGLVLLLAVGGLLVVRRLQAGRPAAGGREIRIKETRRLAAKRALHLVRAGERLLLIGESEVGLQTLADLTPPPPPVPSAALEDAARDREDGGEEEEGAVPRDLVIPQRKPAGARAKALHDFRTLLSKLDAGR